LAHYDKPDYSKLMCLEWSKGVFMKRANSAQKGIRLYHQATIKGTKYWKDDALN